MTPRQRRILVVLAAANVVLVLAGILYVARPSGSVLLDGSPSPAPTLDGRLGLSSVCEERATELLSRAGFGGTVAMADGTLQLDLVYRVPRDGPAGDAAQQAWRVFDIALALAARGCGTFSDLEMVIRPQGDLRQDQAYVAVSLDDLLAFRAGELTEGTLLDRVVYRSEPPPAERP